MYRADSFPAGIKAAFDKPIVVTGTAENRQLFGISFPDKSDRLFMVQSAAAAENSTVKQQCLAAKVLPLKRNLQLRFDKRLHEQYSGHCQSFLLLNCLHILHLSPSDCP